MAKQRYVLGLLTLAFALAAPPAVRAETSTEKRLRALEGALEEAQKEIQRLRKEVREQKATSARMKGTVEETGKVAKDWPEVDTKGKFEVRSKDGDFSFRVGGRVHVDAAFYDNDNDSDLDSGSEFRRARLELAGKVWKVWDFRLQYDFTDSGSEGIRDAFIRYSGLKDYGVKGITVGQFKEPFSLEQLTSSNYVTFMERSLLDSAFMAGRARGAGVNTAFFDKITVTAGLFGEGVDTDDIDNDSSSESWASTGRFTFSPLHEATKAVHLGVAGGWRTPDEGDTIENRTRPESHVTDRRLVDTGDFDADYFTRLGAEAAGVYGPFSLQAEYMQYNVTRQLPGVPNVSFDGFYVYGSYFLTGESRPYEFESGSFGQVKPKGVLGKGGIGAWELAARYSTVDLNDEDIFGGEEDDFTFGLNWYPNSNIRLMFNYVQVLDVKEGPNANEQPAAFQGRAQVNW